MNADAENAESAEFTEKEKDRAERRNPRAQSGVTVPR
jgi:hypothetical protein